MKYKWKACISFLLILLLLGAFAMAVSAKHGLSADEIRTVQRKLKAWGYYDGQVDGIYGAQTTAAVRWFQKKNGLAADGIVGPKTAEKLGMVLSGSEGATGPSSVENADVYLLAKVVYGEARGEPYQGKVAVAAVVLNRVRSPKFPNTIAGVVYQKGAFSIVSDGQIHLAPDAEALQAARDALNGVDPTENCLFYYNPAKTTNQYMLSKPVFIAIGKHNFCR